MTSSEEQSGSAQQKASHWPLWRLQVSWQVKAVQVLASCRSFTHVQPGGRLSKATLPSVTFPHSVGSSWRVVAAAVNGA